MLKHVKRVDCIKFASYRAAIKQIVNTNVKAPMGVHPLSCICDKKRIEVHGRNFFDSLLNNAGPERVGTADLQHVFSALKHPRNELVSREREQCSLRVLIPRFIDHQSKARNAVLFLNSIEN